MFPCTSGFCEQGEKTKPRNEHCRISDPCNTLEVRDFDLIELNPFLQENITSQKLDHLPFVSVSFLCCHPQKSCWFGIEQESCPNQFIKLLLRVIKINFSILLEEDLHTAEHIWMHVELIIQWLEYAA